MYTVGSKQSLHLENCIELYLTIKRKKTAFYKILLSVPYPSRANWWYARGNSDVIMLDVDVTYVV